LAGSSYIRITGTAGAAFSIDGITNSAASGVTDGQVVWIHNASGDSMTVANQSGLETTAANRIKTTTGFGVSFLTNGIANLIYDSGASRWVLINPHSGGDVLGEIYAYDNTVAEPLATAGTYYQITNLLNAGAYSGITLDAANSRMQIQTEGYYQVGFDVSFSGTASQTFTISVYTNGVEASNLEVERKLGTGGDIGAASRQGFAYLPTNCIVDLRVTSDSDSDTITVKHGAIILHQVK